MKKKCNSCHKKQALKFDRKVQGEDLYKCKYCGAGYMPKYHSKNKN
jgi:DNA-directed RNA polymerase subunit RPC12/RpoP